MLSSDLTFDTVLTLDRHIVHSYGWKAIEKRRATPDWEGINDLLTTLLTSVDSETGEKMPDEQIARELGAFIAAGHETSAHCTCSFDSTCFR